MLGKDFFSGGVHHVDLSGTFITDAELGQLNLQELDQLQTLWLTDDDNITDTGLEHLKGLSQLL